MMELGLKKAQAHRGFTLTEIALVLGLIGIILGAIWTAAATVYDNRLVAKAEGQLMMIASNVKSLYANGQQVESTADMFASGANAGASASYLRAGVFPSDTLDTGHPNTATQAYDPWGENIAIMSDGQTPAGIMISFGVPSTSACMKFISSVLNAAPYGLYNIHYQAVPVWAGDLDLQTGTVNMSSITNACVNFSTSFQQAGANNQYIMFAFHLN